ncbi:glycosyltransferase [Deinococcus koreensis]|uniref:Glycosyl transferase n=1 Tax=Deinococcus koreensis TaxID=2054903 RepID=A0A2K3UZL0_9DEIO|nr:glycosyltransferase [Deinococcus koreensis]PNY81963.1 glycosyl transferase [Deinococcus koreensis]
MPAFTVVIPARNEAAYLPATLQALDRQTRRPAEVIVVDNGSLDDTVGVAEAWGATVLPCPQRGVARARQRGLEAARTPWVASTDADSLPVPEWLELLEAATPGRAALYGPMRFCGVAPQWSRLSGVAYSGFLHVCRVIGKPNLGGANMAFDRALALQAGGYPLVDAYEDVILGQELARLGRVSYVRGALVETSARRLERGLLPFLWQHYRNISGHTRGYFGDDRIPPLRREK